MAMGGTPLLLSAGYSKVAPIITLILYMISMIIIAAICRKKSKSLSSFFLADRGLGGWMSAFSYGAAYFSAVVFIGYAGKFGMGMGLSAIWIGLANAIIGAFLAWIVLAKRTRSMTRRLDSRTMPEFFEKRYQNKYIKLVSSIIIFIFLIPYSTSVYQGLGYLFEMIFDIPFYWCIIMMAVLTSLYLFSGGYFATALSDFVQGIIMLGGVIVMLVLMFKAPQVNGIEGLRKLTQAGYGVLPSFEGDRLIDSSAFNVIILIFLTSFGIWSLPHSVHKFYAIKNTSAIKKASIISTAFALIIGVSAYLNGGLARLFFDQIPPEGVDSIVPQMLIKANFPGAMLGLIMVLVLSASMSTLSSISLSGSSALIIDGYKGYIKKDASDNHIKTILRIVCLIFVALSAVLAIYRVDAIVTLMSLSWGTLAGCFMGPYIYGLYSKKVTSTAAMVSIIGGIVATFSMILIFGAIEGGSGFENLIKAGISRAPLIGVITMALSMIITPLVSLFTKKPSEEHIKKCFEGVEN
ncbi:MAG: sodium:solute symporter family protein [Bacillota bacterium]|jgi:SSS family solute:Na+ symporter|nr:sodium:solute symporter family protein [Bacillota bacterium]HHU43997.1 sodium:solute symporter family protein [Clostridiales bacterium]